MQVEKLKEKYNAIVLSGGSGRVHRASAEEEDARCWISRVCSIETGVESRVYHIGWLFREGEGTRVLWDRFEGQEGAEIGVGRCLRRGQRMVGCDERHGLVLQRASRLR